jgi:hypothetical protein
MDFGEFAVNLSPHEAHAQVVAHPLTAEPYSAFAATLPPATMYRTARTDVWHASSTCPRLTNAFVEVSFEPRSLPQHKRPCPTCLSWLATPRGIALAVHAAGLNLVEQPLDWPGLAARRRFLLDPLGAFNVRTMNLVGFFNSLRISLDSVLTELSTQVRTAAPLLPVDVLYDALATPTSESTLAWISRVQPSDAAPPPASLPADLDPAAEPTVRAMFASPVLAQFAEGSLVQRVLDLFAARYPLSASSLVMTVPASLYPILAGVRSTESVLVEPSDSLDVLRFTDRLFASSPARGLPAALAASRRLLRSGAVSSP